MMRAITVALVALTLAGCATTFRPTDQSAWGSAGAAQIAFDQANYGCKRDVAQASQGRSVGAAWNNNDVRSRNTAVGWLVGNIVAGAVSDHQMYVDCMRAYGFTPQN